MRALYELESPRGLSCPTCGAKAGKKCRMIGGRLWRTRMHRERVEAYNRAVDKRIRLARYADFM